MTSDNNTAATEPITMSEADARRPRVGTILWGIFIVAFAAMFFTAAQLDLDEVNGWLVLAWCILALGAVLIVGGLVAAIFRRR